MADYIITSNTTALAVQGLKWNGKQGFQKAPSQEFVVPIINNTALNTENWAGGSVQGEVHSERGFTLATVKTSGHMVPQYAPPAAFRQLEHLLGRVESLTEPEPFSINISTSFKWPY
ncbi:hypothetical protein NXS19_007953 [Fusarium pseudograminearum]|nr:hypothetical protein NXS19_007953 [Fusarium pseudograminearum]